MLLVYITWVDRVTLGLTPVLSSASPTSSHTPWYTWLLNRVGSLVALLSIYSLGILRLSYGAYYHNFGITPEEIGLDSGTLLGSAALGLAVFASILVLAIYVTSFALLQIFVAMLAIRQRQGSQDAKRDSAGSEDKSASRRLHVRRAVVVGVTAVALAAGYYSSTVIPVPLLAVALLCVPAVLAWDSVRQHRLQELYPHTVAAAATYACSLTAIFLLALTAAAAEGAQTPVRHLVTGLLPCTAAVLVLLWRDTGRIVGSESRSSLTTWRARLAAAALVAILATGSMIVVLAALDGRQAAVTGQAGTSFLSSVARAPVTCVRVAPVTCVRVEWLGDQRPRDLPVHGLYLGESRGRTVLYVVAQGSVRVPTGNVVLGTAQPSLCTR